MVLVLLKVILFCFAFLKVPLRICFPRLEPRCLGFLDVVVAKVTRERAATT